MLVRGTHNCLRSLRCPLILIFLAVALSCLVSRYLSLPLSPYILRKGGEGYVTMRSGWIRVEWSRYQTPATKTPLSKPSASTTVRFGPLQWTSYPRHLTVMVDVFWPLCLIGAISLFARWRGFRRALCCEQCKYDLRGLSGSVCPECGNSATTSF
jgi:hypothetical protein